MLALVAVTGGLIGTSTRGWQDHDIKRITRTHVFPELPSAFSAIVEANILNKNYTMRMNEYYSSSTQRLKMETFVHKDHALSSRTTTMVDISANQYIHVVNDSLHGWSADRGGGVCTWGDIDHISQKRLGSKFLVTDSEGPHLISSTRMFAFVNTSATKYEGTAEVRGMVCDKWTFHQCFGPCEFGMGHMNLEFYFTSLSSWRMPGARRYTHVPVRIVLNGARPEKKFDKGKGFGKQSPPSDMHTFEHVYDYVEFHVGEPSSEHFQQPCGVVCTSVNKEWNSAQLPVRDCARPVCEGREGANSAVPETFPGPVDKEIFPTLPESYSATIEIKNDITRSTSHYQVLIDSYSELMTHSLIAPTHPHTRPHSLTLPGVL